MQTAILLPITIWVRFSCCKLFRRPLELLSVRAAVDLDIHDQVYPGSQLAAARLDNAGCDVQCGAGMQWHPQVSAGVCPCGGCRKRRCVHFMCTTATSLAAIVPLQPVVSVGHRACCRVASLLMQQPEHLTS